MVHGRSFRSNFKHSRLFVEIYWKLVDKEKYSTLYIMIGLQIKDERRQLLLLNIIII